MFTALMLIINFIIIFFILKLIISKSSKYIINKCTFNDNSFNYLKKVQIRMNYIVMFLNMLFLFLSSSIKLFSSPTMLTILAIIDCFVVISLGAFTKLQNSLNK